MEDSIDRVYYSSTENSVQKDYQHHEIRDIESVQDFLRAVEMLLSNYYLSYYGIDPDIRAYENIFSRNDKESYADAIVDGVYFRGESKRYAHVQPGVYRNLNYFVNEDIIFREIERFHPGGFKDLSTNFEKISHLQHFGAPTRLLDMTENALVALYFAISANFEKDGYIYVVAGKNIDSAPSLQEVVVKSALSRLSAIQKIYLSSLRGEYDSCVNLESIDDKYESISTLVKVVKDDMGYDQRVIKLSELFGSVLVKPSRFNSRISQQSGVFILCGLEEIDDIENFSDDLNKFPDELLCQNRLTRDGFDRLLKKLDTFSKRFGENFYNRFLFPYAPEDYLKYNRSNNVRSIIRIQGKYKKRILNQLRMLGVHAGSVYPDFPHVIKGVSEVYSETSIANMESLLDNFKEDG